MRQVVPVHDAVGGVVGGGSRSRRLGSRRTPCATTRVAATMASSAVRVVPGPLRLCHACTMITASSDTLQRMCRRQASRLQDTTVRSGCTMLWVAPVRATTATTAETAMI